MLNFVALYQFFFKSFAVGRDREMVENLKHDGYEFIYLIKRSWLYGLASLLWLFPLLFIGGVNVYLILRHFNFSQFGIVIAGIVVINIIWTIIFSVLYIRDFRYSYRRNAHILPIATLQENLVDADKSFIRCFNQLQFNFFIFLGIIGVYIVHIFFISETFLVGYAILDVICIMIQLLIIRKFLHLIIDLEMDFTVFVKGKIAFVNQVGMYSNIDTIDSDKIKNIRSEYPSFLASFFEYGTIDILTEGDQQLLGHNRIEYVDRPEKTIETISSILLGKGKIFEDIHNAYLKKILSQFPNLSPEERKKRIAQYLKDYEHQIKKDYQESNDPQVRKEIEEIYRQHYGR